MVLSGERAGLGHPDPVDGCGTQRRDRRGRKRIVAQIGVRRRGVQGRQRRPRHRQPQSALDRAGVRRLDFQQAGHRGERGREHQRHRDRQQGGRDHHVAGRKRQAVGGGQRKREGRQCRHRSTRTGPAHQGGAAPSVRYVRSEQAAEAESSPDHDHAHRDEPRHDGGNGPQQRGAILSPQMPQGLGQLQAQQEEGGRLQQHGDSPPHRGHLEAPLVGGIGVGRLRGHQCGQHHCKDARSARRLGAEIERYGRHEQHGAVRGGVVAAAQQQHQQPPPEQPERHSHRHGLHQ